MKTKPCKLEGGRRQGIWLWCLLLLLQSLAAHAELTATVTAGYEFDVENGENITLDKLNSLGLPSVQVSGTVDGSALSAGGVNAIHLNGTNVIDWVTIIGGYIGGTSSVLRVNYDGTSLGIIGGASLGVLTNGITTVQVTDASLTADDLATNTLTMANLLTNWPAGLASTTVAATDLVVIGDASAGTNATTATVSSLAIPAWTTNSISLATNGLVLNAAHGLGRMPYRIEAWLVALSAAEGGYATGDAIRCPPFRTYSSDLTVQVEAINVGANPTNVWVTLSDQPNKRFTAKNGTVGQTWTGTNWTLAVNVW